MTSSSNNSYSPTLDELHQAMKEFSAWIVTVTPGAIPFVCCGLALAMHGSGRSTKDADLAIDLSRTRRPQSGRPYDTNALKGLATSNPDKFIVGPKIFWILDAGTDRAKPVQVDFVDANLFWAPFNAEAMVDFSFQGVARPLNLPTLLVSKMRSALERSQSDVRERLLKQINDVQDFCFALTQIVKANPPQRLADIHIAHLGPDELSRLTTINAFWALVDDLSQTLDTTEVKEQWKTLINNSFLGMQYLQYA